MIIKDLHIDGFGIFCDADIKNFEHGVNVIYGPNEFGKTTLLEFIRRVLFGFPNKKNRVNMYPALNGGNYGGYLSCIMDDGRTVVISRHGLTKGGTVKVEDGEHILLGQHELDLMLGTSVNFFRNVYAITIDEIQELGSLEDEDIKNRIYGAGLELGSVSLGDLRNNLTDRAGNIYRPQGKIQFMPERYRQLSEIRQRIKDSRQELPLFMDKTGQLNVLENHSTALGSEVEELKRKLRDRERLRELYNDFIEVDSFQLKLTAIPEVIELPKDLFVRLEKLKGEQEKLEEESKNNRIEHAAAQESLKRISINAPLLERRGEVIALERKSAVYASSVEDAAALEKRRDELKRKIADGISRLGIDWSTDALEQFNVTVFQREQADKVRSDLAAAREELSQVEFKQRHDLEQRRREADTQYAREHRRGLVFTGILIVAGIAAVIIGIFKSYILSGFGVFMIVAGMVDGILRNRKRGADHSAPEITSIYEDELNDLLKKCDALEHAWEHLMQSLKVPAEITPSNFDSFVAGIDKLQADNSLLNDTRRELDQKRSRIEEIKNDYNRIIGLLEAVPSGELTADVELLSSELERSESEQEKQRSLKERASELELRKSAIEQQHAEVHKKIVNFFAAFGVENEHQLKLLQEQSLERQDIENKLEILSGRMKKVIGAGCGFEDFMERLKNTDPVVLDDELEEFRETLKAKETELQENREAVGSIKKELENLASHDELIKLRNQEEALIRELNDLAREWAAYTVAQKVLEQAVEKYEKERQPGVITHASKVFAGVTDGRYNAIFRPVDSDELFVRNSAGKSVNVADLSRGTREELYLAMRLGLIAEYETRAESLPLIMDDVMVNFDDERAERAVKAVCEFAKKRQVIVMTCSSQNLDRYVAAGGKVLMGQ